MDRSAARPAWKQGFADDYRVIFVEPWSAYTGAALLVLVTAVLTGSGLFWGVFGGIRLWGDYLNNALGLGPLLGIDTELESPLMHRISLLNITLLLGAFCAALLSRQFRFNRPPGLEYLWAMLGGSMMGVGAVLAGGCTTGGFFVPLTYASASGWSMWFGLLIGALLGLRLLLWTMEHIRWGMSPKAAFPAPLKRWYPLMGLLVFCLMVFWAATWWNSPEEMTAARAILVPAGFAIGFILHRSRFCFSRVFREPFMTAEGEMTRAMILAIALGAPVTAGLIAAGTIDPYLVVPPRFWIGSLLGGLVFGIGMVFAGGCASGTLWRVGEGHLKLMVALLFFAWSGSTFSAILGRLGWLSTEIDIDFYDGLVEFTALGYQAYLPQLLGSWSYSLGLTALVLALWYALVRYNESTSRFTVL